MQRGNKNSFFGRKHTKEAKLSQKKGVTGAKNAMFGRIRAGTKSAKKQSRKMKKLFKTGKWVPVEQPKGKDSPMFQVPRSKEVVKRISAGLKNKKKTRKHRASLAIAAVQQKFKK